MKRLKVATVVGTRPEIIKLSRVIHELDQTMEHVFVHTGQNYDYELNEIFFQDMGIRKPDHFLNAAGENAAETIGNVIIKTDKLFRDIRPDAILIYGDTNSCLCVISAKRLKIPVFHMEAGNRCFDQRVPEELNRKVVDHLSDINLTLTEHARRYLIQEGLRPEMVIKTGSCMKEVLEFYQDSISRSQILKTLDLKPKQFFTVSAHREENIDVPSRLNTLLETLNQVAEKYRMPVVVSVHPRTQKRLNELPDFKTKANPMIRFLKPLGFSDYVNLQKNSFCVISDSGTITEEASILGLPAVTIRDSHERPEGMDQGTLVMCGLTPDSVLHAIEIVTRDTGQSRPSLNLISDYDVNDVSKKVSRIIASYVGYVNQFVWKKAAPL